MSLLRLGRHPKMGRRKILIFMISSRRKEEGCREWKGILTNLRKEGRAGFLGRGLEKKYRV